MDSPRTAITGEPDPVPDVGVLELVVHPPLVNVRVLRTARGQLCGIAQIQTQRGPITLTATADERAIRTLVSLMCARKLRGRPRPVASSGALQDWVNDTSAKVAKARVIHKLLGQAQAVSKNPTIARAVGLSTVVVPGHGSAILALQSANELLAGLKRRDARAIAAWRKMQASARLGNDKARRGLHVIDLVARAPRLIAHH